MLYFLLLTLAGVAFGAEGEDQEIHQAARRDDVEWLKNVLKNGADINAIGAGGQTPLVAAALSGSPNVANFLLKRGADYSIGEKDGYTAVHAAAFQGRPKVIKVLADHGLDLDDIHADGFSPIHRAAWGQGGKNRHIAAIQALYDAGANILVQSRQAPQQQAPEMAKDPEAKKLLVYLRRKYIEGHAEAVKKHGIHQTTHGHLHSGHEHHDKTEQHRKLGQAHHAAREAIAREENAKKEMAARLKKMYEDGDHHEWEEYHRNERDDHVHAGHHGHDEL